MYVNHLFNKKRKGILKFKFDVHKKGEKNNYPSQNIITKHQSTQHNGELDMGRILCDNQNS